MQIRTRFAPSPTGDMHIGNLRTAIFNWIFARKSTGLFFVRIEDTDHARSKETYEKRIFEILKWMELDFDLFNNSIVRQSERNQIYIDFAKKIPNTYYCKCDNGFFCSCYNYCYVDGVLRFKVEKNILLSYKDLVFGNLVTNSNQIENFALLRSDGKATYNLAVVIDDYLMKISHVIRGEDHKTNTFKQIMIYKAMNWIIPEFAHLPIIKGKDGKKLSKRENSSSAQDIYENGICSKSLFNILVKLGWSYGDEEIISREKVLELFQIDGIRRSSTTFEQGKLYNFSRKYMLHSKNEAINFLEKFYGKVNQETFHYFYNELSMKCETFKDMIRIAPFLLDQDIYAKKKLLNMSLEDLMNKDIEEQKNIRFLITGSENGLSLKSIWNFYNNL